MKVLVFHIQGLALPLLLILCFYIHQIPKHAQKLIRTSSFEELIRNYISRIKQGAFIGNFANNGSVERYLREHPTPTSTEEEVQNWFNGLMMELPSFERKILVESTHNDPYLDGFKPG